MADDRPLRFTDSPQNYLPSTMSTTSGLGSISGSGTQPPTPSPRRKSSATSFSEMAEMQPEHHNDIRPPMFIPGTLDYSSLIDQALYYHPSPTHYPQSSVDTSLPSHGYFGNSPLDLAAENSELTFSSSGSNYFPYRPEMANARDYKSYPDYGYEVANYYPHRNRWGFNGVRQNLSRPQMGVNAGHRRTLSNISSTSSNINQGFQFEETDEIDAMEHLRNLNIDHGVPSVGRMRMYENLPFGSSNDKQCDYSLDGPHEYNNGGILPVERPLTLPFEQNANVSRRSSLKKYVRTGISNGTTATGHGTTPTNPTPTESLTSDDSSYLSAKDSISSQSRVRFSPDALLDGNQPSLLDPLSPLLAQHNAYRRARRSSSVGNEPLPSDHSS